MALTNLRTAFRVAVSAGETAIRINTDEQTDAIKTLTETCKKYGWGLQVWDRAYGVEIVVGEETKKQPPTPPPTKHSGSPMNILDQIGGGAAAQQPPANGLVELMRFWEEPAKIDSAKPGEVLPVILVMKNMHLTFEGRREEPVAVVQRIVGDKVHDHKKYGKLKHEIYDPHGVDAASDTGKFIVGLMPAEVKLPPEIDPLFRTINHELPDEEELAHIFDGVRPSGDEDDDGTATTEEKKSACKFALGLTRAQAEGVFAASIVSHGRVLPSYVWQEKSAILNREGLVELHTGTEKFKDVAGLDGAKDLMRKLLTPDQFDDDDPDCRAKGALFVGPPGVGKSLIAKATGNELGLPTLMVNPGNLMGSYVGESEAKTRKMFQILKAHAPCITVMDEVEKVMPSSRGGGGDSGVGSRMEGSFLTALNDTTQQIFWVFTANDVKRMHEAFFRAERVDAVFYVPLPTVSQRAALWKLYMRKFFPKEVVVKGQTVAYPHHLVLDVDAVLADFGKSKKPNLPAWGRKLTAALMTLDAAARADAEVQVENTNSDLAMHIKVIKDEGWSPAEIRACCRLSRKLKEPLAQTQKRVRPVSVSAAGVIKSLELWASESALDANTGEIYVSPDVVFEEGEEEIPRYKKTDTTARRKVKRLKP